MIIAYLNCSGEVCVLLDHCPHLSRDKEDAQSGFALQTGSYPLLADQWNHHKGNLQEKTRANGAEGCQVNNF